MMGRRSCNSCAKERGKGCWERIILNGKIIAIFKKGEERSWRKKSRRRNGVSEKRRSKTKPSIKPTSYKLPKGEYSQLFA